MLNFVSNKNNMKTIETETGKQKFAPGLKLNRDKFLNHRQEKLLMIAFLLILLLQITAKVNAIKNAMQYTVSSGVHSIYAPVENLKWENPAFAVSAGINRMFGEKQFFSVGFQAEFAPQTYQGNATSLQLLGQFTPVIFRNVELGIGLGAGYRFSKYPSKTYKWSGNAWENGKKFKGMVQIPVQLSAGFREIQFSSLGVTPFVAYQLKALFGYNPDFEPLPDSNIMFGFKFHFNRN
jgi:hypothetical protein